CPVLAMHGDKDEYGSLRHPEVIREYAAGPVELAILTNCGHVRYKEQPGPLLDLIGAFLRRGVELLVTVRGGRRSEALPGARRPCRAARAQGGGSALHMCRRSRCRPDCRDSRSRASA